MKIILENTQFDYDNGVKILKLKGGDSPFEALNDIWNDIVPMTFKEIAQLTNVEQRRIAINYMGIDKLVSQVKPKLLDRQVIDKTTTWITENGEVETLNFKDTYELYEVKREVLLGDKAFNALNEFYYVKFKDTSTDREYMIWVDIRSVCNTNEINMWRDDWVKKVTATQCIAWTIMTNVPKGNIEKIVRQGDCIMIKPKDKSISNVNNAQRHLTEEEYLSLLELES